MNTIDRAEMPAQQRRIVDIVVVCVVFFLLFSGLAVGLLCGLLSACAAYGVTSFVRNFRIRNAGKPIGGGAAALFVITPVFIGLIAAGAEISRYAAELASNYNSLINLLILAVSDFCVNLPEIVRIQLPSDPEEFKTFLKDLVRARVPAITELGQAWAHGALMTIVGAVIGLMIAIDNKKIVDTALSSSFRQRGQVLFGTFRQVVVAQFWIACVNTILTALFIFLIVPIFGVSMPYPQWLILLTFLAGMIPIVGNLLVNVVITLSGLSVQPQLAVVCLIFLIGIHKLEYVINAKIFGSKTNISAWEIIAVMAAFECFFGVAGLVAAPLFYAYFKAELRSLALN